MWILLLRKFWPYLLLAAIVTATVHKADSWYYNSREKTALSDQEKKLNEQCTADKEITKGVSHAYQDKIAKLRGDVTNLNKLFDHTCVPIAHPPTGDHAAAGRGEPAGSDGIHAQALLAFAGDAEGYRLQLIGCQDFITQVWKARGQ